MILVVGVEGFGLESLEVGTVPYDLGAEVCTKEGA